MAQFFEMDPGTYVASQLVEEDFAEVAAKGFRSVVNNRPDGEPAGHWMLSPLRLSINF